MKRKIGLSFNTLIHKYKKRIIVILLIFFVLLLFFILVPFLFRGGSASSEELVMPLEDLTTSSKDSDAIKNIWNHYKKINEDYIGQIVFDSNLVNKPFVQAKSCYKSNGEPYRFFNQNGSLVTEYDNYNGNDVYIWMDFETMEYDYDNKGGSIFLDYRNNLDDQNLIIYGHYFSTIYNKDPERVKAFTPLEKLLNPTNYKDNNIVKLVLQNEIRTYELWAVYKFDSSNPDYFDKCQYFRPNYNVDDYFNIINNDYYSNYIEFVNKIRLYDTDVELSTNDKTLTFQTCMTPDNNLYEICVFKLINSENY